jgi:hypothetical protein
MTNVRFGWKTDPRSQSRQEHRRDLSERSVDGRIGEKEHSFGRLSSRLGATLIAGGRNV